MVEDVYASSFISIHTPLAGSDAPAKGRTGGEENFNPHSPCGERLRYLNPMRSSPYFNPHSPCGERQHQSCSGPRIRSISIHTPLAGSDRRSILPVLLMMSFQSTLPLRGATRHLQLGRERRQISIHTPLAGSDTPPCVLSAAVIDFNPHSPCGERRGWPDRS